MAGKDGGSASCTGLHNVCGRTEYLVFDVRLSIRYTGTKYRREGFCMKTVGLLGGMSWESTVTYYQILNRTVKEQLGGFHSARLLMYSVDFAELEDAMGRGDWEHITGILTDAAQRLAQAGADFLAICTNTMHKVAPDIAAKLSIPILHIGDATADAMKAWGVHKALLLGTRYTMTQSFLRERLEAAGMEILVPGEADIETVNRIVFEELCLGVVSDASRKVYLDIIQKAENAGIQGVILGCTEIGLLIRPTDTNLPVFDTAQIHAEAIAAYALEG